MSATDLYLQNLGQKIEALTFEVSELKRELAQFAQYIKCSNCDRLYDCDNNWDGTCLKEVE